MRVIKLTIIIIYAGDRYETRVPIVVVVYEVACFGAPINGMSSVRETNLKGASKGTRHAIPKAVSR